VLPRLDWPLAQGPGELTGGVAGARDPLRWTGLLASVTAPFAVSIARNVRDAVNARQMNYILFKTAQLHMRFGVLMALGLGIGLILEEI
jgi:1,4-dihydroxy-2-naphthoate octaprenyltransferase